MKQITAIALLLCLCFLCFGCSLTQEASAAPQIRYEDSTAYYTQNGARYTMDIQFDRPVTEGSTVSLLLEEEEVLGFTAEAGFSHLRLSSIELELNQPYKLKINGELQRHGNSRPLTDSTEPGYIPDPTVSTVPQEPMGEATSSGAVEETASSAVSSTPSSQDSLLDTPPTVALNDSFLQEHSSPQTEEETPDSPTVNTNATLASTSLNEDKEPSQSSSLQSNIQWGGISFTLTATVTGFSSVQNAS